MCKAQNYFQLVLVKLFSQTYYCSDQVLARYMSTVNWWYLNKSLPPPPIFFWHFPSSVTTSLFTICSTLLMFWSSNIRISLHLGSSESHKPLAKSLSMNAFHPASLFLFFSWPCSHQWRNSIFCIETHTQLTIPLFTLMKGECSKYQLWNS